MSKIVWICLILLAGKDTLGYPAQETVGDSNVDICVKRGRIPNKESSDCSEYILCSNLTDGSFRADHYKCPGQTIFSWDQNSCVSANNFECPNSVVVVIENSEDSGNLVASEITTESAQESVEFNQTTSSAPETYETSTELPKIPQAELEVLEIPHPSSTASPEPFEIPSEQPTVQESEKPSVEPEVTKEEASTAIPETMAPEISTENKHVTDSKTAPEATTGNSEIAPFTTSSEETVEAHEKTTKYEISSATNTPTSSQETQEVPEHPVSGGDHEYQDYSEYQEINGDIPSFDLDLILDVKRVPNSCEFSSPMEFYCQETGTFLDHSDINW
jgi:hypothetical protein